MSYEITGKLIAKFDIVQRTETFKTREFVLENSEDANGRSFVNYIKLQCVQDKTGMPDKFNIGEEVKVQFNIRGTRWEKDGKTNYFTNLDAWKMDSVKPGQQNSNPQEVNYNDIPPSDNDDLPF